MLRLDFQVRARRLSTCCPVWGLSRWPVALFVAVPVCGPFGLLRCCALVPLPGAVGACSLVQGFPPPCRCRYFQRTLEKFLVQTPELLDRPYQRVVPYCLSRAHYEKDIWQSFSTGRVRTISTWGRCWTIMWLPLTSWTLSWQNTAVSSTATARHMLNTLRQSTGSVLLSRRLDGCCKGPGILGTRGFALNPRVITSLCLRWSWFRWLPRPSCGGGWLSLAALQLALVDFSGRVSFCQVSEEIF